MPERVCQILVFGLLVAFVILCGCEALQFAESKGPEAGEEIELCWKAAKGEKLNYDYYDTVSETGETGKKEITIRWAEDVAAVSFDRERVIMDKQGRFPASDYALLPNEQFRFFLSSLFPLPSGKIKKGESWTIEVKGFSGSITATFGGFEDWQGNNCAVITIDAKSTSVVEAPRFTFTTIKTLAGKALFDIAAGRFVKGELTGEGVSTSRLKPQKAQELAPPEEKTTEKFRTGYTLRSE